MFLVPIRFLRYVSSSKFHPHPDSQHSQLKENDTVTHDY